MMPSSIAVLFPHQLSLRSSFLKAKMTVVLVEDPLFFSQYHFHAKKLVMHRASLKHAASRLKEMGHEVIYVDASQAENETWIRKASEEGVKEIVMEDPVDYLLLRRWKRYTTRMNIRLRLEESLHFLCKEEEIHSFFEKKKRYFLYDFYVAQRKTKRYLLDATGQPIGGKWTFDDENRLKIPKGTVIPKPIQLGVDSFFEEAVDYVNKHFPHAPGDANGMRYPITREEALNVLDDFIEHRLRWYGMYQDAMIHNESFLFHSLLTPALNIGLLDPKHIIERVIDAGIEKNIPINAIEGFVRQVLGWREYIRAVYVREGVNERTTNYWNFHRRIPASFWSGTTGVVPVDAVIQRSLKTAYAHHIERLMIMGNFMVLCRFHPDEVYRWFMEMYIDAYDWVMVPNVYGMSQYADGGLMSTKPYISGSNYVLKMSNYAKGDWCQVWDGLFWLFIEDHRDFFLKNPRLSMMARTLDKMDAGKKQFLFERASDFMQKMDSED